MTSTQIFHGTNVVVATAPPIYEVPSANGVNISGSAIGYELVVDSNGYAFTPGGLHAAVETLNGQTWTERGRWVMDLGPYTSDDTGLTTTINTASFTVANGIPSHTRTRIRVDVMTGGTLAAVTINQLS